MSVPQPPYNYAIDAVARSTGSTQQNMFCPSVADNVENPTQIVNISNVTIAGASFLNLPAALFAPGTGLYYVSYTITASGLSQGAIGRVTVAGGATTGASGFGAFVSTGGANYIQMYSQNPNVTLSNASGASITVSLSATKIAA